MTPNDKIVEAVARALCRRQIVSNLRWEKEKPTPEFIQRCEDAGWESGDWIDQARSAITAFQAEAWQPIETAPKDGTHILAWHPDHGPVEAVYHGDDDPEYYSGWVSYHADQDFSPTHWQPLPPPPKASP